MNKKLFIGNLPWTLTDEGLSNLFTGSFRIVSAQVILDRETGRSRGFGFVEFENEQDAKVALDTQNGRTVEGRKIIINEAKPEPSSRSVAAPVSQIPPLESAINDFASHAVIGDHYGFSLGNKHFTVTMDEPERKIS